MSRLAKFLKKKPKKCPHCGGVLPVGRGEGPAAYGTSAKFPEERKGLAEILACRRAGMTIRWIAEHMDELGFKLRRGQKWNPGTISRIIRREEGRDATKAKPGQVVEK